MNALMQVLRAAGASFPPADHTADGMAISHEALASKTEHGMLGVMARRHFPQYSVLTRRCSLHPHRFRWLLISNDNAHKIHAPISYSTESEALECGMAEVLGSGGSRRSLG
ncbi:hypothetical protein MKK67_18580 [Methylobacterium sp. J-072]|uniref:hypothetical protein n=1 Tax=Methylobacterium sp. J-072 TaxID=2836651 RepID=UPI001FB8B971|nr:hypothetical protein [Methylobacterium sp. J-072]MCJ2094481.1 hypothetical protein [Methylobacterium sp. J-072]